MAMSEGNGEYQSERLKRKKVIEYWKTHMKDMMKHGFKPTIVIYAKIEAEGGPREVTFSVHHPNLPPPIVTKTLIMCAQTVAKQAQKEALLSGPRIILPGQG